MEEEAPRRLYRSNNGMIAGVCGGIADYFWLGPDAGTCRLYTVEYIYCVFRGYSLFDTLDSYT